VAITSPALRHWTSFGTGAGVEIGARDLLVSLVRVRPSGKRLIAEKRIENFRERPAAEWGAEIASVLRGAGAPNYPVTVLLPRQDVIVRVVMLPGVEDKDIAPAISYQVDALHPFPEQEATYCWARLPASGSVLVGIARREVIAEYASLFAEAGLRVASFTFSAAALYGALRILNHPPAGFLTLLGEEGALEVYGESAAKPVFSGVFARPAEAVTPLVRNELRLAEDEMAQPVDGLMGLGVGMGTALSAAAALTGACPWLTLQANLLPVEQRWQVSRFRYVPTAALAVLLAVAMALLSAQPSMEDAGYLKRLQEAARPLEKEAGKVAELDKRVEHAERRMAILHRFRQRSRADADVLLEVTALLTPPAWLQSLQLNRTEVTLSGEAEQAAPLLKLLDESKLFHNSRFGQQMGRGGGGESFVIKMGREGEGTGQ